VDAERARRVGVRFAAVLTGVTARDAFAPWRPYAIIDDLTELPAVVLEGLDVDREWGLDPDGDWGRS
jgi:phosphoglycolate phosphatase-like HAD superfamily hydrolase